VVGELSSDVMGKRGKTFRRDMLPTTSTSDNAE